jgi:MOSC domain-containing protein YiiM
MRIMSVNRASVSTLMVGGRPVKTAIGKRAVHGEVRITAQGLEGDQQADPRHHGGPRRAVYAYPQEHYAFWQTVRAQARVCLWDETLPPGFLGENLTLKGLLESQLWVGDELIFANAKLVVTEPRQPCGKFNAVMGFNQASQLMRQSAWCGFYLAVKQEGSLQAGEAFECVAGPRELRLDELFRHQSAARAGRHS